MGFLVLLASCGGHSLAAPAPRQITLTAPPDSVLRAAEAILGGIGWTAVEKKRQPNSIRAQHEARGDANGDWLECESGVGKKTDSRRATRDLRSTVAVEVSAVPLKGGSSVHVEAAVLAYSMFPMADPRTINNLVASKCVSSGTIEALLVDSLAVRFPVAGTKP